MGQGITRPGVAGNHGHLIGETIPEYIVPFIGKGPAVSDEVRLQSVPEPPLTTANDSLAWFTRGTMVINPRLFLRNSFLSM